ncbi:MAG TPA: DUF748 domain-containing protein [Thermoanaerobaculia bacterium]|nr:DUF748 domain-containing protein [Thermoanaerobaculia bacterium]
MRLQRRDESDRRERDEPTGPPLPVHEPEEATSGAPDSPGTAPQDPGISRRLLWWILAAAVLLLITLVAQNFDEYLRRMLEAKMNQRLHGYTVTLQHAHLNPFGLALTLGGAVIRQQAHPTPPVAQIDEVTASVQWREILRLKLVANVVIDRPRIHINLPQLREEDRDEVEIEDRGWQEAFQSIYPLKFNQVQIVDGGLVYVDEDPERPLQLSQVNLIAENIRNTRDDKLIYPSPVRATGTLFGKGRGAIEGHADFLSEPHPGVHVLYRLENVPLDRLDMFSSRANLDLDGGILRSRGEVEYSPRHREAHIADITIGDVRLDYIHTAATSSAEKERASEVAEAATDDTPPMLLRIDRLQLDDSTLGLVNRAADSSYRVYVNQADLVVTRLSSGFQDGPAAFKLNGKFMGSGKVRGAATFREEKNGPDFDMDVAVENASLPAMNELLRAYGKLDVTEGTFSVYSEIKVQNGRIEGYVKPLIKDVKVYDKEQDKKKPVLKKIYEKVVGGLAHALDNRPRDEVATVADISGPIDDPKTGTWEIIVRLVSNAFVKAILPGFDREVEAARKG